jgi:putative endonuclease
MYYFYVLYSLKDHKLYKGYSANLPKRFLKHTNGGVSSTKHRRPLILIHLEIFDSKTEAMARERWAKSPQGGPALKSILIEKGILDQNFQLISSSGGRPEDPCLDLRKVANNGKLTLIFSESQKGCRSRINTPFSFAVK